MKNVPTPSFYIEEKSLLYVDIPKSGCSTVRHFFLGLLGEDLSFSVHKRPERSYPVPPAEYTFTPPQFCFTFMRDPLERFTSCYREKIRRPDFESEYFTRGIFKAFHRYGIPPGVSFPRFAELAFAFSETESNAHWRSQSTILEDFLARHSLDGLWIFPIEKMDQVLGGIRDVFFTAEGGGAPVRRLNSSKDIEGLMPAPTVSSELNASISRRYESDLNLRGKIFSQSYFSADELSRKRGPKGS